MPQVFVYGTLRAGEANDILLAAQRHGIAAPTLIGVGTIAGHLYDFGNYPGLVLDRAGGPVLGDIYEIADALVPVLDEIEEIYPGQPSLFVRRTHVVTSAERALACLLYPVAESTVAGLPRIESGDWVGYRRARDIGTARVRQPE